MRNVGPGSLSSVPDGAVACCAKSVSGAASNRNFHWGVISKVQPQGELNAARRSGSYGARIQQRCDSPETRRRAGWIGPDAARRVGVNRLVENVEHLGSKIQFH